MSAALTIRADGDGIDAPSADDVAIAIVTAARLYDEDPEAILAGASGSRARWVAARALKLTFPDVPQRKLVDLCGGRALVEAGVAAARKAPWWNEAHVDAVLLALQRGAL